MKKILIIEDDTFLQGLEAGKLKKSDFDVSTAGNGKDGVALLEKSGYDVVLLDLMLPDMDGYAVLEQFRTTDKKTPVIVFSNLAEEKDIEKAKKLGANEFMIKSNFTLEELVEKIEALVK